MSAAVLTTPLPPIPRSALPDDQRLAQIDAELAKIPSGANGTQPGLLLEEKGEILARSGKLNEAALAFDKAAATYLRTPEGTGLPPKRAARARQRAVEVRAHLRPDSGTP